jgi:hypothetical protein
MRVVALFFLLSLLQFTKANAIGEDSSSMMPGNVIVKTAVDRNGMCSVWKDAIINRMSKHHFDSLSSISRELTIKEKDWKRLIESKSTKWKGFIDSLNVPFDKIKLLDTIYVLLGYLGWDDGFTYNSQTVCFDLTALYENYGEAFLAVNDGRIDRLFAHELTHLFHKEWARQNNPHLRSFKDSILWECIYEGIGMYRSLSGKWLPHQGVVPEIAKQTLANLNRVFTENIIAIQSDQLTDKDKAEIQTGVSRGPVDKKWGAFPVAIWLALEAKGDDSNLAEWIDKGPQVVIDLAIKYLPSPLKIRLEKAIVR